MRRALAIASVLLAAGALAVFATGSGDAGISALVALGRLYDDFAATLRTSDIPSYLTGEQATMYRMAVDDQAYAMDQKAAAHYAEAVATSFRLTLYGEDSAWAARRLGELRPDEGLYERLPGGPYIALRGPVVTSFEPTL